MRHLMLSAATLVLAFGISACEREVKTVEKTVEKGGTTIVQPKETVKEKETVLVQPTPGPAGPAGPEGEKGAPGKPGGDTTVIVTPPTPEPKKY